jgi:hypothetical protein
MLDALVAASVLPPTLIEHNAQSQQTTFNGVDHLLLMMMMMNLPRVLLIVHCIHIN